MLKVTKAPVRRKVLRSTRLPAATRPARSLSCERSHSIGVVGHSDQAFTQGFHLQTAQQRSEKQFLYQRALWATIDGYLYRGFTTVCTFLLPGVNNWAAEYVLMQRRGTPHLPIRLVLLLPREKRPKYTAQELSLIKQADRRLYVDIADGDRFLHEMARQCGLLLSIQFAKSAAHVSALGMQMGAKVETLWPQDLMRSIQDPS